MIVAVESLGCGEIMARGAGGAVGFDEVLIVLACVSVARCELGEAAHLWVSEFLEPWLRVKGGAKDKGGQVGLAALFYRV